VVALITLSAVMTLAAQTAGPSSRVLVTATGAFVDVDAMVADLATADVVFLGEARARSAGVAGTELAIVKGLAAKRGTSLVLALGMFGRDVQEPFDHFSMGHIDDGELAASTGPWSDEQADHQAIIDFIGGRGRPIIASNAASRLIAEVASSGMAALDAHAADDALFARERQCDASGPEFTRFAASRAHADGVAVSPSSDMLSHAYAATCLEDETIGESIAQAASVGSSANARPFVVSVNAAARSDYRAGAVERTHRRLPAARLAVVSFVLTDRINDAAAPPDAAARADYVVYVQQP
jgi:hypothetical protein